MKAEEIGFFLHQQGEKPCVVTAKSGDTLRAALLATGVVFKPDDEHLVFVGECVEALAEKDEVEDGCDEHAAVDIDLTVEVLQLAHHRHVHRHRCDRIAVDTHFGGKTKRHRFSPATTIEVVTAWARKKFKLDPSSASEYILQICDTKIQPRPDEHLGEVVKPGECAACFDLVNEVTPQG